MMEEGEELLVMGCFQIEMPLVGAVLRCKEWDLRALTRPKVETT